LTATYEVSQAPIREAMQLLKQEGLVRIYPRSRTVVTRIDMAHFLRVALETEVCRRLSADPDPAAVTRARSIIKMQEAGRHAAVAAIRDHLSRTIAKVEELRSDFPHCFA
jgi:DNA-binding GntR family transcriptional regulator